MPYGRNVLGVGRHKSHNVDNPATPGRSRMFFGANPFSRGLHLSAMNYVFTAEKSLLRSQTRCKLVSLADGHLMVSETMMRLRKYLQQQWPTAMLGQLPTRAL